MRGSIGRFLKLCAAVFLTHMKLRRIWLLWPGLPRREKRNHVHTGMVSPYKSLAIPNRFCLMFWMVDDDERLARIKLL